MKRALAALRLDTAYTEGGWAPPVLPPEPVLTGIARMRAERTEPDAAPTRCAAILSGIRARAALWRDGRAPAEARGDLVRTRTARIVYVEERHKHWLRYYPSPRRLAGSLGTTHGLNFYLCEITDIVAEPAVVGRKLAAILNDSDVCFENLSADTAAEYEAARDEEVARIQRAEARTKTEAAE